ncbi:MAG: hypothetical protein KDB61_02265 [Planctomycetes bacterium]|nr:hypothetical protein [Planctomycetota bacterium]
MQFGNFPYFTMDAFGGAVFSWYSSSPSLQCYVQRVDTLGSELFPHNGVAVANTAGQLRVDPHASYDATTNSVYVAWKELNSTQSQSGLSAQRIDPTGTLMWGPSGMTIKPLGGPDHNMPRVLAGGASGGALIVWDEAPAFGADVLRGVHLDSTGLVDVPMFDVSTVPSGKMRMSIANHPLGFAVLPWSDDRIDGDIFVQAVGFDGVLGGSSNITTFCDPGTANSTGLPAVLSGSMGTGVGSGLHLDVSQGPPTNLGYFLVGNMSTPPFVVSNGNLCLVGVPGAQFYRYNVAGSDMLSVGFFDGGGNLQNVSGTSTTGYGYDVPTTIPGTVPFAIMAGDTWHFQCWHRDTPAGVGSSNFSNGLSVTF